MIISVYREFEGWAQLAGRVLKRTSALAAVLDSYV
jgi:hypothetical protein